MKPKSDNHRGLYRKDNRLQNYRPVPMRNDPIQYIREMASNIPGELLMQSEITSTDCCDCGIKVGQKIRSTKQNETKRFKLCM